MLRNSLTQSDLLPGVWREVCRHIEIEASTTAVARAVIIILRP